MNLLAGQNRKIRIYLALQNLKIMITVRNYSTVTKSIHYPSFDPLFNSVVNMSKYHCAIMHLCSCGSKTHPDFTHSELFLCISPLSRIHREDSNSYKGLYVKCLVEMRRCQQDVLLLHA